MTTDQIYRDVSNIFIDILQTHISFPERPWICLGADNDRAYNPISGKFFRNVNPFLLSFAMMEKDYLKNEWATQKQIELMSGKVREGEKPVTILPFISSARIYQVFNLYAQTESLPENFYKLNPKAELSDVEKDEVTEALIKSSGATVFEAKRHDAFYWDNYDCITIPILKEFHKRDHSYHNICLHVLGLWTGGKDHLNRRGRIAGNGYIDKEHLTAEFISAMICSHLGFEKMITTNTKHIQNWITLLKSDPKSIVNIAAAAQKGADFILDIASKPSP